LVPQAAPFEAWLGLFELEKALYEVEYAADHRPDWVRTRSPPSSDCC
jgi:predicted trehalose synthase